MKILHDFTGKLFESLLQLVYPPICISCNRLIREATPIRQLCPNCLGNFQPIPQELVRTSILRRLDFANINEILVAAQFDERLQAVIHYFKYRRMNNLAFRIANYLKTYLQGYLASQNIDLVFPVPLHPARVKERGYNQSAYIARGLFDGSNTPVVCGILIRVRQTESQTRLNREERRLNVSGAFQLLQTEILAGRQLHWWTM